MHQVCQDLPVRTVPVFCGDYNAQFGINEYGYYTEGVDQVFTCGQKETGQGKEVKEWAIKYHLVAMNRIPSLTTSGQEPTFYASNKKSTSSIDYVFTTRRDFDEGNVYNLQVDPQLGRILQLNKTIHNQDHVPMWVNVKMTLPTTVTKQTTDGWDFKQIMQSVLTGHRRQEFFDQVEKEIEHHKDELTTAHHNNDTTQMYHHINAAIVSAADMYRMNYKAPNPKKDTVLQEKQELMKQRQALALKKPAFPYSQIKGITGRKTWKKTLVKLWLWGIKIAKIETKLKRICRQIRKKQHAIHLTQIIECHQKNDSMGEWKATNDMCHTKNSAKRKWGTSPKTSNPNMDETYLRMQRNPQQGGMGAQLVHNYDEGATSSKGYETLYQEHTQTQNKYDSVVD